MSRLQWARQTVRGLPSDPARPRAGCISRVAVFRNPQDSCAKRMGIDHMKLRIKGSSLRLRLTQGEVHSLETAGEVAEEVHFGGGARLTYRLRTDTKNQQISASYGNNVIDIRVPQETALTWARTDQVTLSHEEAVADGELRVVI